MSLASTISYREQTAAIRNRAAGLAKVNYRAMRSPRAFQAVLLTVASVPAALIAEATSEPGAALLLSFGAVSGLLTLAAATADFRTNGWTRRLGAFSASALGVAILLLGLNGATNADLDLGYAGPAAVAALVGGLLTWGIDVLRLDSTGGTRLFGAASLSAVIAAGVYALVAGTTIEAGVALGVATVAAMAWVLLEGTKSVGDTEQTPF
jgi:hypothetical protein